MVNSISSNASINHHHILFASQWTMWSRLSYFHTKVKIYSYKITVHHISQCPYYHSQASFHSQWLEDWNMCNLVPFLKLHEKLLSILINGHMWGSLHIKAILMKNLHFLPLLERLIHSLSSSASETNIMANSVWWFLCKTTHCTMVHHVWTNHLCQTSVGKHWSHKMQC